MIGPTTECPCQRLVTCGMGAIKMNIPKELQNIAYDRVEIIFTLPYGFAIKEDEDYKKVSIKIEANKKTIEELNKITEVLPKICLDANNNIVNQYNYTNGQIIEGLHLNGVKDDSNKIRKLLHTIPEPYKEVFMWRVFADLSFKQIGQLFNKSDNWACVTYHRARLMIKEKMEDRYE